MPALKRLVSPRDSGLQFGPPILAMLSRLFTAEKLGAQGHSAPSLLSQEPMGEALPSEWPVNAAAQKK